MSNKPKSPSYKPESPSDDPASPPHSPVSPSYDPANLDYDPSSPSKRAKTRSDGTFVKATASATTASAASAAAAPTGDTSVFRHKAPKTRDTVKFNDTVTRVEIPTREPPLTNKERMAIYDLALDLLFKEFAPSVLTCDHILEYAGLNLPMVKDKIHRYPASAEPTGDEPSDSQPTPAAEPTIDEPSDSGKECYLCKYDQEPSDSEPCVLCGEAPRVGMTNFCSKQECKPEEGDCPRCGGDMADPYEGPDGEICTNCGEAEAYGKDCYLCNSAVEKDKEPQNGRCEDCDEEFDD